MTTLHRTAGERFTVELTLNGQRRSAQAEARMLLCDFLRHELQAFGVHVGCEHGVCGACTVLLDGRPVRSCLMFAVQAEGAAIRTVEGLADGDALHPLQQAFWQHHGLQCGFCTPGFLMLAAGVLEADPAIDDVPKAKAVANLLEGEEVHRAPEKDAQQVGHQGGAARGVEEGHRPTPPASPRGAARDGRSGGRTLAARPSARSR